MPVNYAQFLAGVPSPVDRIQEGVLAGQQGQLNTQQIQQNEVILQNQQAAQQAAQVAAARKAAINAELVTLSQNPDRTARDMQDFIIRNPEYSEQMTAPMNQMSEEQQAATLNEVVNVKAAFSGGQPEVAKRILQDKIDAATNSGDIAAADQAKIMLKTIEADPDAAMLVIDTFIAANDPEKFADISASLQTQATERAMAPVNLSKKLADLDYTETQTAKIINDMRKGEEKGFITLSPERVAALGFPDGAVVQEDDAGKLFIINAGLLKDEAARAAKEGIALKDIEKDRANAGQIVNIIDKMIGNPDLNIPEHPGLRAAVGPYDARTPTFVEDTRNFEVIHEQLKGKAFLMAYQELKGGGTITEIEGNKAEAAQARLNAAQSEPEFISALTEMRGMANDRAAGIINIDVMNNEQLSALDPAALTKEQGVRANKRWKELNG